MELLKYSIEDFENFFDQIFDDKIQKKDVKEFLLRLNKANLPQNAFIGAVKSLKRRMVAIKSPVGAIDVCGTGGDGLNSLNISTAVSFVVAGAGVCVAKHGNKAMSSNSGSADIFQELGIEITNEKKIIENSLLENNLCFLFAPLFHQSLKNVVEVRRELGVATIFNFLGPLLNPCNTKFQLIGTSNKDSMQKMASVISWDQVNHKQDSSVFIVHGFDKMDEITLCDDSYLIKCKNGNISDEEIIDPEDLGFKKIDISQIKGKDPKYNAKKLIELLEGQKSAYRDIVILNSAFALQIAKKFENIQDAIKCAKESIDNNNALRVYQKAAKII